LYILLLLLIVNTALLFCDAKVRNYFESTKYFLIKNLEFNTFYKNNDGLLSQATHHPTKNLTIQIMENKERYHNATSSTL